MDLNKYLIPFFVWAILTYSLSFVLDFAWVAVFFIVFPYLFFADYSQAPGFHVFDSAKYVAYSGGILKKFIHISSGLVSSKYGKSVVEHEIAHNEGRHSEIKYSFIAVYSAAIATLIGYRVSPLVFAINLLFIYFVNYLLVVFLEIKADLSVTNKKLLINFLSLRPKKTLCNAVRVHFLSR